MDTEPTLPSDDLDRLRESPRPPAALEGRVIGALRAEGLLRQTRPTMRAAVAAAAALFVVGVLAGHYYWPAAPSSGPASVQRRYLFLLAGDVTPAPAGESRAAEYGQWARNVAAAGVTVTGDELLDGATLVSAGRTRPFEELAGVGGYFIVSAGSDDEAAALARSSPHVKYGGSVVVRRIVSR
jgi:hypothetical protein